MPTYEYICRNEECQHAFEIFQSMKDDALTICPRCNQPTLKRKIGLGAGIIFKGSGFYETDYKRRSTPGNNKQTSVPKTETKKETTAKADG